jgi:tetratricopeptide (TPR) repeat protein
VLTPSNKEKLIAGAQKFVEKGQFDKAIREYLKIVAEDENDVRIWIRIGDLYVKLGQKSEAVENYKKVAQLYAQEAQPEKAVAVYKQILQIDPQALETHGLLAALYRDMGRMQHAAQQYELAAQAYTRAGKVRDSLTAEQAIVDMMPDNIARRIRLAEMYSRENLYPDAAREFSAAAAVLRSTGRMEDFAKVVERLLFHAPDNLEATKDLSRYYLQQGDAVRALTKLQPAFKVDRKDVELLDLLAQAFERMNKPDKAVSVLRELARIYTERGALSAADSVNRRILELDPKDDAARAALSHSGPAKRVVMTTQTTPSPNLNAALFNSPVPQVVPGSGSGPGSGPGSGSGPLPKQSSVSAAVTPAFGSAAPSPQQLAAAAEEEAARVIAEAESFVRFGLARRAVEHLLNTLQARPGLRAVRERLAKLYEAQGQPRSALAELRLLLAQAPGPGDEQRLLREIVRLDNKDEAAAARLRALNQTTSQGEAEGEDDEPEISVSSAGGSAAASEDSGSLRRGTPTDAATTSRMPLEQFHRFVQEQSLLRTRPPPTNPLPATTSSARTPAAGMSPSQVTQPNAEMIAAAAEEMALTSGTLKEELDEVDFFLQQKMHDEARQLLKSLLLRYPHSKTVQAKQKEVDGQAIVDDVVIDVDVDEVRELDAESTARLRVDAAREVADERRTDKMPPVGAGPKPPGPLGKLPPLPPPRVPAPPPRPPVAPSTTSLPPALASSRSLPGAVPSRTEKTVSSAEASGAFRLGVSYRNRGQYGQAVSEFQKAMADPRRAGRAALMLGLCYRDQNQLREAIEAFKEGVHMPNLSDPDLGELHYQLGRSYEQLGENGEAIHFYQLALKPSGRFKDADARVAALQGKSSRSLR